MNVSKEFKSLGLRPEVLSNLESLGYLEMTPIQAQSLPFILANKDLIGQANTGSGKTAAFGLGILSKLDTARSHPQALVLCPTRELAEQVCTELRRLARFTNNIKVLSLCGGTKERHKARSLEHGAHIIVGTPGRIKQLLEKKTLNVKYVKILVLDEADRMLEMGFINEINEIAAFTPVNRQTLLFSATFPNGIKTLSLSLQENAEQVTVDSQHEENRINQLFFKVEDEESKPQTLMLLLGHFKPESAIIFCKSKDTCTKLNHLLRKQRISALEIHSELEQKDRTLVLVKFSNKSCCILVATDVAARGLDIKDVQAVINYDLPTDHEMYVHRIGRTGRIGKEGLSLSLYTKKEASRLEKIAEYLKKPCVSMDLGLLNVNSSFTLKPPMTTIYISGGRKDNMRPGDILGALTKDAGLLGKDVGNIQILEVNSYVAIATEQADVAVERLNAGKIKGRRFRVGKA